MPGLFLAVLFLLSVAPGRAADPLEAELTAILGSHRVPGAGIAIVNRDGGTKLYSLGLADLASKRPVTQDTLFRTASVGKMFTALAVMRLVEDGQLALDAPLRSVAPDVAFENAWEGSAPVRVSHLLEHTTGWDDIHFAEYAYDNRAEVPLTTALAFHPDSRHSRWPPGARKSYANSGPTVAGYVVQKVSGKMFEAFVAQHVFQPLRMDSATYFADASYKRNGATLYDGRASIVPYKHILYRPAGSTNVSAADLGKLVSFFLQRGMVDGRQLFARASIERMEGTAGRTSMGIEQMGYRGVRFSGHGGSIDGAVSHVWYQPELGIGYVAMLNNEDQGALWKIRDAVLSNLMRDVAPVPPAAALGSNWQGVDGLYMMVNPRIELARSILPLGAIRLAYTPAYLERSSAMKGWRDKLLPGPGGTAIEPFSGLPVVTRASDPLAGDVVLIGESVYARASALHVYGVAGLGAMLLLMSGTALLFALVWIPRRMLGKIDAGTAVSVRVLPLAATVLLGAAVLIMPVFQPSMALIGTASAITLGLMVLSAAYGMVAVAALVHVIRERSSRMHRGAYWFCAVHAALHFCAAVYLGLHGILGIRLWA